MAFTSSEIIDRNPQEVWDFLTDWSRASEWMPGIESMRQEPPGERGVGVQLVFGARGAERASEVTAWDPPKLLTLRSTQGGVTADYVYRLEAAGAGTRLTLDADCRTTGFLWGLARPLISFAMARSDRVQPARLKQALER